VRQLVNCIVGWILVGQTSTAFQSRICYCGVNDTKFPPQSLTQSQPLFSGLLVALCAATYSYTV